MRSGSRDAAGQLIELHYAKVYRFLFHLTRDSNAAADLTQETFRVAWERLATFQGQASFSTWLHRIAYRKHIDAARTASRDILKHQGNRPSPILQQDPTPLSQAMRAESAEELYAAVQRLGDDERLVIMLRYFQGMRLREIALVAGQPEGTVKWRHATALRRLRVLLHHHEACR